MKIAFDVELMRPGCVIIQAALGGDPACAQKFPTSSWLLAPTHAMRVYPVTDHQLAQLVQMVKEKKQCPVA